MMMARLTWLKTLRPLPWAATKVRTRWLKLRSAFPMTVGTSTCHEHVNGCHENITSDWE